MERELDARQDAGLQRRHVAPHDAACRLRREPGLPMTNPDLLLAHLHRTAPAATAHWQTATHALDAALRQFPGHRLFTILVIDWTRQQNQRIYSSAPDRYPSGGAKPLVPSSEFYQDVILGGRARICVDRAACQRAFTDHALIDALGCASAVNVPVVRSGVTIGSLNLLHRSGWYGPEMLPTLRLFADYAAAVLLRHTPGAPT